MKFYNRTNELTELQRIKNLSFNDYSRMTIITGRRRIGKTSLIIKSTENEPTVYLFVSRKTEATLCIEYTKVISSAL
ncbi:MAG: ATP-binding protein, partial [Bacteroidales bacterium]|nr:ATP-binding protein [Bacteroidales bacterium]